MASLSIISSISSLQPHSPITRTSFRHLHVTNPAVVTFSGYRYHRKMRGLEVVTRAGASASSYLFAAVFPLSLLAITIFTSIKIADNLDKDFLEDVTINQAVKEGEEDNEDNDNEDNDNDDDATFLEEIVKEPVIPRTRNRPKREV